MGLMNNQMSLALGGLKDEGGEIDETSGNRVPIGGTKEGVRDDIEINISEGEFVFPADVVRYHGLDKMMALRQEAKMGLKQMERMGQMGNSDEATMPDDLPFSIADLIVVGGKGEPMEFSEGGFVPYTPKFKTLEIEDVPMMDNQERISYEGYTSPKITMKEYRNEEGESIIITYINGVSIIPIPEGYTLYVPPEEDDVEDDVEDDPVQKAVNTVNDYDGSNETDFVEQSAPDYRVMNNDEFFAYMTERNSFGGKAGNALAIAVGSLIPIPGVGLLTLGAMKNHENNLMTDMKSRIDRMLDGPQKIAALAAYKEYSGEIDPNKKTGLLNTVTDFVMGLAVPLANALGINKQDVAKTAKQAAVAGVSGAGTAIEATPATQTQQAIPTGRGINMTVPATQTQQTIPTGIGGLTNRVDAPGAAFNYSSGPAGTVGYNTGQVDPRLAAAAAKMPKGNIQTTSADQQITIQGAPPIISRGATAPQPAPLPNEYTAFATGPDPTSIMNAYTGETSVRSERTGPDFDAPVEATNVASPASPASPAMPTSIIPDVVPESPFTTRRDGPNELSYIDDSTFRDTRNIGARADYNLQRTQTPVEKAQQVAYNARRTNERVKAAQQPVVTQQNVVPSNQQSLYTGEQAQADELREQSFTMPSDPRQAATGITYGAGTSFTPSQTDQAFGVPTAGTVTGPRGGYTQTELQNVQAQREAAALQASPDMFGPVATPIRSSVPDMISSPVAQPAARETPAQRRAKEAAVQRARIQTRNKEIAVAIDKIPNRIKKSSYYNDQVKAGFTGSTIGGYAVGKIAGSDGDSRGVVQKADGKVQKVRDVEGYENLKGTQRGAMTVFQDSNGNQYVKSTTGKLTNLNGSKYTGPGDAQGGGTGKSGSTGSGRSRSDIQADINRAANAAGKDAQGNQNWTSELNDLVAERDNSSNNSSSSSSSSNQQSGTGFFRGADEEGNTGSDSSKGGYSCYVATALSEKGYWSHTQKIKLIKWCMEAKPEGKLDTTLWRNGYCIFGKNIIAPKVDNKIIQWLSNGFYHATINNKKTLQAILGRLFFIIPSYTIGIWKALRGSLVDIERT